MNLKESLEYFYQFFINHKICSPRLEAQILHSYVLDIPVEKLILHEKQLLREKDSNALRKLSIRKVADEPTAYLTSSKEFFSQNFIVNSYTLIPRPETEELVELVLADANIISSQNLVGIDLCCGSGCIGVILLQHLVHLDSLYFLDICDVALKVTKMNCNKLYFSSSCFNASSKEVLYLKSDLLAELYIFKYAETFDFIVANPPYVTEEEYIALERTVKDYEPKKALLIPEKPPIFFNRLWKQIIYLLKKGGKAFIEINPMLIQAQRDAILQTGFKKCYIYKDLALKERFLVIEK